MYLVEMVQVNIVLFSCWYLWLGDAYITSNLFYSLFDSAINCFNYASEPDDHIYLSHIFPSFFQVVAIDIQSSLQ
jgi:hypothetical protein